MSSLYKNPKERIADILVANSSTAMRFKPTQDGKLRLAATSDMERVYLKEDQAEALARLTIDKAMQG